MDPPLAPFSPLSPPRQPHPASASEPPLPPTPRRIPLPPSPAHRAPPAPPCLPTPPPFSDPVLRRSSEPVPLWHPTRIALSALRPLRTLAQDVLECAWPPEAQVPVHAQPAPPTAVAKIASTDGHALLLAHEATVYCRIEQVRPPAPLVPRRSAAVDAHLGLAAAVAPKFLAHVVDAEGRGIGFLLEKVDGRHARRPPPPGRGRKRDRRSADKLSLETDAQRKAAALGMYAFAHDDDDGDVGACRRALERLHLLAIEHCDVHCENFIIRDDGGAVVLDFEYSRLNPSQEDLQREMDDLETSLSRKPRRPVGKT
ncbi:hypothetical protein BROUX41_003797 [Berkeleyomyces rouxiae]|uniref:uncharacterized protein n=1 Tax=Berkeleyomyces rouxiae TaxID=2035830 RepID=UPI003B7F3455